MLGDDVGCGKVGEMLLSECWAIIGYGRISNLQLPGKDWQSLLEVHNGTTTVLSFEDDRTRDDHLHDLSISFLYLTCCSIDPPKRSFVGSKMVTGPRKSRWDRWCFLLAAAGWCGSEHLRISASGHVDSQTVGTLVGEIHFEVENHTKKSDASWDWLGFIEPD